jgi:Flp pilus assembly protein TadD
VKFGIKVAQLGLWREALAHWERAIKLDPTYAQAYNNLAIGYEQQGDFDKARNAYQKALELNPSNQYIKQNYELFKEINDRTNKQDGR